jgi:hypothetical protein
MLHIVTALYRPELLDKIYKSIPKHKDIRWHVAKSNERISLQYDFIYEDDRVILYNVDCSDVESWTKRQTCLDQINKGYFCFLDDDTVFHENMYKEYQKLKEEGYVGMLVGKQENSKGKIRLGANLPRFCQIDIGNVIAHSKCNKHIEFPVKVESRTSARDYQYWRDVFKYYTRNNTRLVKRVISVYNALKV